MGINQPTVGYRWLQAPSAVDEALSGQLATCWWEVSNAGGAVGFPFLPVDKADVEAAVGQLVGSLDPEVRTLLVAVGDEVLLGWLLLERNSTPLTDHWARVLRLQTALGARGSGIGRALMTEAARAARDDLGLEQLHIEVRGGQGLEAFYESCGWREIGRWPGALRLGPNDDRDQVLMFLPLSGRGEAPEEGEKRHRRVDGHRAYDLP
ncbi:MAG TPA: GNAT family N-acetyltransferase [Acidimicrobiales bacterium]|nr:GNAT family N-acetyltransferase [Acidimicrobiales bacterium]